MFNFVSKNEDETKDLARKIAEKLQKGDIIILSGDLGSGKTKFTEGFLSFWNLQDEISSPTFTIVNEHHKDDINIYHFDVYRLEDIDEFYAIGGQEYFEKGISVIEWGEMIESILPKEYMKIEFSKDETDENIRYLKISTNSDRLNDALKEINI